MSITEYLREIERAYKQGNATEHTYRPFLKSLIEARANGAADATNEPKREECGAPDYVVSRTRDRLTLGYIEAKDFGLGLNLGEVEKDEQLKRYLQHLPNLLLTDYLEVRWYVLGEKGTEKRGAACLGRIGPGGKIATDAAEQARALRIIDSFLHQKPARINSAQELALRLAHLTHMVRDTIVEAFANGAATRQLLDWREAFAKTLLPDLEIHADREREARARAEFADMFAQTLAYGLFSAHAAGPGGRFTREQARKLIPRTNPFLRTFFEQITGTALDDEPFAGFVDDLIQTLDHAGMDNILADFGKRGRKSDPVVHFYETFLQAYDPKLRELRGVYYTPEPVVNYIVESLDILLKDKTKFDIKDGLADRSRIKVPAVAGVSDFARAEHGHAVEDSHRVLILDPATGTATFLYRVLDFIREQFDKKRNLGAWGDYVHEHLLPRLFGFELLMAPYAVAHFKIGLALAAWDKEPLFREALSYQPHSGERINIFLTNTLEDMEEKAAQLGPLRMLSDEANAAYEIKRNKPVLVILGNPPYSGHSANKSKWISDLVRDYYRCDGKPLGERNSKWLQDDYVKFIRWAQWRIEQTGQGVLGFITNNGYLDNPTFRGMRQSLMQTFDEIYLLDLHGSSKKKETDPATGAPDKNVFDIQQGVAIGIFVKLPGGPKPRKRGCIVRHADLRGAKRQAKYDWLNSHSVGDTRWTKVEPITPNYFFFPENRLLASNYKAGWRVPDMMPFTKIGPNSHRDSFAIAFSQHEARTRLRDLANDELSPQRFLEKYNLVESADWSVGAARGYSLDKVTPRRCLYRPFDERIMISGRFIFDRPREELNHHFDFENVGLLSTRQTKELFSVFSTTLPVGQHKLVTPYDGSYVSPLYLYPNGKLPDGDLFVREESEAEKRRPNFSAAFIKYLCERLKVKFVPDGLGNPSKRAVGPELIFNYAYAVFHSPGYRERYAGFLRTDFPRLPITSHYELFLKLAEFGGCLVDLHARKNGGTIDSSFPVKGDNEVKELRYEPPRIEGKDRHGGRVWINGLQYFDDVSEAVWQFPIGGYLPAQRWLKDRIGRTLGYDDLTAYPRIINALGETGRLMSEIEKAIESHGGWPGAFA